MLLENHCQKLFPIKHWLKLNLNWIGLKRSSLKCLGARLAFHESWVLPRHFKHVFRRARPAPPPVARFSSPRALVAFLAKKAAAAESLSFLSRWRLSSDSWHFKLPACHSRRPKHKDSAVARRDDANVLPSNGVCKELDSTVGSLTSY